MAGYSRTEFERFAKKISDQMGETVKLGVRRLSDKIVADIIRDPRLRGPGMRGPSGRIVSVLESSELGEPLARAVLEINPAVGFRTIYPVTKKVLKFEWPLAPVGVSMDPRQPKFPTVYYKYVRVPYVIPIDWVDVRAMKAFDSRDFQYWLDRMIDKGFVSANFK